MHDAWYREAHDALVYARDRGCDSACARGTKAQAALALASAGQALHEEAIAKGVEALERRTPLDEDTWLRTHTEIALLEDAIKRGLVHWS